MDGEVITEMRTAAASAVATNVSIYYMNATIIIMKYYSLQSGSPASQARNIKYACDYCYKG